LRLQLGPDAFRIESIGRDEDNTTMNAKPTTAPSPIGEIFSFENDPDTLAVIEKLMTGKPLDPEVYRRIRAEAARISEEVYRKHGLLDIGVPAIRALRDGEDE
jgi:hypothetical protein